MTIYRIITSTGSVHQVEVTKPRPLEALKQAVERLTNKDRKDWYDWGGWNVSAFSPQEGKQIFDPAEMITAEAFDERGDFCGGITVRTIRPASWQ